MLAREVDTGRMRRNPYLKQARFSGHDVKLPARSRRCRRPPNSPSKAVQQRSGQRVGAF
jgi:hypothetical protein